MTQTIPTHKKCIKTTVKSIVAIIAASNISTASSAEISKVANNSFLLNGPISHEDISNFKIVQKKSNVYIDSPGGDENAAFQIAKQIREKNINVTIYGRCSSACNLLFLAARNKVVLPYAYIGMHGLFWNSGSETLSNQCTKENRNCSYFKMRSKRIAEKISYFKKIGVKAEIFSFFQKNFAMHGKYAYFPLCDYDMNDEIKYTKISRATISNSCYLTWGEQNGNNDVELFIPDKEFFNKHGVTGISYFWFAKTERQKNYIRKHYETGRVVFHDEMRSSGSNKD